MSFIKYLLAFAAMIEAATGLVLLIYPSAIIWLLFNAEITELAAVISRLAGISLIALSIACWPGRTSAEHSYRSIRAMLFYNFCAALYFIYLGFAGIWNGILLWPAALLHSVLALLLAWQWIKSLT